VPGILQKKQQCEKHVGVPPSLHFLNQKYAVTTAQQKCMNIQYSASNKILVM
jgi:hypothetical protein